MRMRRIEAEGVCFHGLMHFSRQYLSCMYINHQYPAQIISSLLEGLKECVRSDNVQCLFDKYILAAKYSLDIPSVTHY